MASSTTSNASPVSAEEEASIREFITSYSNMERLTPFRTKQLLKAALKPGPPIPPEKDNCCGCNCTPCVKDEFRELVRVWYESRGLDVGEPGKLLGADEKD